MNIDDTVYWFYDESYFSMWAVRPVGDKDFNSPRLFHVSTREDAIKLVGLLNSASVST